MRRSTESRSSRPRMHACHMMHDSMMGLSAGTSAAPAPHPLLYIDDLAMQVRSGGHPRQWWWDSGGAGRGGGGGSDGDDPETSTLTGAGKGGHGRRVRRWHRGRTAMATVGWGTAEGGGGGGGDTSGGGGGGDTCGGDDVVVVVGGGDGAVVGT